MSPKQKTRSFKGMRNAALRKNIDERLVVMARFLDGLGRVSTKCVLKGGLAIQLRTERKRSTKDIDLVTSGSQDDFLDVLQAAAATDRGDRIHFTVNPEPRRPTLPELPDMPYGGQRYQVIADDGAGNNRLTFTIEVVFGRLPSAETIRSYVLEPLDFPPVEFPAVSVLNQLADKIWLCCEASRTPAPFESRYRDLADVYLLSTDIDGRSADELHEAIADEFERRSTTTRDDTPTRLPDPPPEWLTNSKHTKTLCAFTGLPSTEELLAQTRDFVDPMLSRSVRAERWDTANRQWMLPAHAVPKT